MKNNHKRNGKEPRSLWVRVIALLAVAAIVLTSGILALAEEPSEAETVQVETLKAEGTDAADPAADDPAAPADPADTDGEVEPVATQPMYRLYNPNTHEHLYTADTNERDTLILVGWDYEGIGWYAPVKSETPVYRVFHPGVSDHHYTTDYIEYQHLIANGWNDEGIAWYSAKEGNIPVYREYSPVLTTGAHNFTTDLNEHNTLVSWGTWNDEGIAWYGMDGPKKAPSETLPANFMYLRDAGDVVIAKVYNPCGMKKADHVNALVWSEGHEADDLGGYEGWFDGDAYLIFIPKRDRMERGTVHILISAENGAAHTDIGYLPYNLTTVEWKNGWVYAHKLWYHYDANGNVTALSDTIPGYVWNDLSTEEFTFVSDAHSTARVDMLLRANDYSSPSKYIILVNRTTHTTGVYEGAKGRWKEVMYVTVSDGAPRTPTVEGTFKVGIKMRYFDSEGHRLFYATQFYYDYLFHSISYYQDPEPLRIRDGRLGVPISHGCVRMVLEDAKWIYDNIPSGTTVVVYH